MKTLEAKVEQFLLGCKSPVNRGIVVQEQVPLGELSAGGFSFLFSLYEGNKLQKLNSGFMQRTPHEAQYTC